MSNLHIVARHGRAVKAHDGLFASVYQRSCLHPHHHSLLSHVRRTTHNPFASFKHRSYLRNPRTLNPTRGFVISASFNKKSSITEVVGTFSSNKHELQSTKIDPDIRRRVEQAITQGNCAVTVGDIAATAGITIFQAEQAIKALAADSLATLQVSSSGEILYSFPRDFKQKITSKSMLLRLEPTIQKIGFASQYLVRASFGLMLFISITTTTTAIYLLLTAASSGRDRGDRGGHSIHFHMNPFFLTDMIDLLFNPFYYRRRAMLRGSYQGSRKEGMSFVEAIYSFVFGDGDPNATYEELRWKALGRFIQDQGGVVTAEQMAPFLDMSEKQLKDLYRSYGIMNTSDNSKTIVYANDDASVAVDESFVLPALMRFGGSPQTDDQGQILYAFPSLQQTGSTKGYADSITKSSAPFIPSQQQPPSIALEKRWDFSAISQGQKIMISMLGLLNLGLVGYLGIQVTKPAIRQMLVQYGMFTPRITSIFYVFVAYAVSFFLIPFIRSLMNAAKNIAIDQRNQVKKKALGMVCGPPPRLQAKLNSAAQQAQRTIVSEDVVYRSDKNMDEQPVDNEADAWERRLERRASMREQEKKRLR